MIGITRPDGSTLRLEFTHTHVKGKSGADFGKETRTRYRSECFLYLWEPTHSLGCRRVLSHGNSFCSVLEVLRPGQSMKATGRAIAMARALHDAVRFGFITKLEMGQLFAAYANRPRGKVARKVQAYNIATKHQTQVTE